MEDEYSDTHCLACFFVTQLMDIGRGLLTYQTIALSNMYHTTGYTVRSYPAPHGTEHGTAHVARDAKHRS